MRLFLSIVLLTCWVIPTNGVFAQAQLNFETGGVWQQRNDVRIPEATGNLFALNDVVGSGPNSFVRLGFSTTWYDMHSLRLVYAPLRIQEKGELPQTVDFAGSTFGEGEVVATYQFDAHRATYRYRALRRSDAALYVGFTVLVRDAEIRLSQNDNESRDTNVGLVPLLHLSGHCAINSDWQLSFDFDGLAAPQGRAFDVGLQADYLFNDQWSWFLGYRLLDGGVDNDEVYNFARFHYATTGLRMRF